MNTFNSFCIAACMFMIFIGLASVVVNSLGIFSVTPVSPPSGNSSSGTSVFENMTWNITGGTGHIDFGNVWVIGTGGLSFAAIALAILTRTTNMIGIWLFGSIFWSSWTSMNYLFYSGGLLNFGAGLAIIGMLWVGMMIIFAGAVVGMLSGSIWMR